MRFNKCMDKHCTNTYPSETENKCERSTRKKSDNLIDEHNSYHFHFFFWLAQAQQNYFKKIYSNPQTATEGKAKKVKSKFCFTFSSFNFFLHVSTCACFGEGRNFKY